MPSRFCLKRPCFPFSISERDLSGLDPGPVTGLPRLPLSISASTDSCSIRFSFLTMMSGAPSSSSFFSLLFLFITLLYKSFKSDVAKRPPSSCTIGLRSGGITGTTSSTIHSGLLLDSLNASTTSRRRTIRTFFWPVASLSLLLRSSLNSSRLIFARSSCTASAPMAALNVSPGSFLASLNCCSDKTSL